jgi:hypothetical protein
MVREGIVLEYKITEKRIEVEKMKIEVIEQLLPPTNVKGIHSFLGHAGFYRRFIQNFSQVARPLTHLLAKDALFVFTEDFLQAFHTLKKALVSAPVIQPPNWHLPFEIMCEASDYAVGAVLDQSKDKKQYAISYASKTLIELCHNGEGTSCRGLCYREVHVILSGCYVYCLYRSSYPQVSLDEERCKTTPDPVDTSTS